MKNFWVVKKPTCCSWAWKKFLQLSRSRAQFLVENRGWPFYVTLLTGILGGRWIGFSRMCLSITLAFSREASVEDLYAEDGQALRSVLESWEIPLSSLSLNQDCFCWKDNLAGFTVATAWEVFRRKKPRVLWHRFIWNNAITPRYQFRLWLVAKHRLPTQAFVLTEGASQR